MPDLVEACRNCRRPKAVDGFPFCGGSYCLHDDERPREEPDDEAFDREIDEWMNDGGAEAA